MSCGISFIWCERSDSDSFTVAVKAQEHVYGLQLDCNIYKKS